MRHAIRRTLICLTALAAVVAGGRIAYADAILVTPTILFSGKYLTCSVTNYDNKTITVLAQAYDGAGGFYQGFNVFDGCSLSGLASGHACYLTVVPSDTFLHGGLCRFVVSSNKVKASLQVRDAADGATILIVPAEKP